MTDFKIPLKNKAGEIVAYALVDEEDYEQVNKCIWCLSNGYANSTKYGRMHRFVMNAKKGDPIVDHMNNNKLDNKKSNLRFATASQNAQNRRKKENCFSKYIGVSYYKQNKKWRCRVLDENIFFEIEEHAAYWYDQLAIKLFGSNAKINKVEKPEDFVEPREKEIKNLPIGISLNGKKYIARISNKYLGTFKTIEEAENVYNIKKEEIKKEKNKIIQEIIRNEDGIAIIKASNEEEILVDDDKYYILNKYSWCMDKNNYAQGYINGKIIKMHRYLINAQDGEIIDHINNNSKDNRLSNLRKSNNSLNNHNKIKKEGCSSKYIGVCLTKTGKYRVQIRKDKIKYNLGNFQLEKDAANAYDAKAIELYGIYAKLNSQNILQIN